MNTAINHHDPRPIVKPIERVSFIYPPYSHVRNDPGLKAVRDNYGVFPPLSLAYAAAVAEREGLAVQLIDANALEWGPARTAAAVREFRPDLLAFTITTYMFYLTLKWIRVLREVVDAPVLIGGQHLSFYPRESLTHTEIDYGLMGEAEICLPPLLAVSREGKNPAEVPGLARRVDGHVKINPPASPLADLDAAPFPLRHPLPHDRYYSFMSHRRNFTVLMSSRGCPFRCTFCPLGGVPFRARSADNVCQEIAECLERYEVREIDFFDATFTVDKRRVLEIGDQINRRGLSFAWAMRSRLDLLDRGLLAALAGAGCRRVYFGIESADPGLQQRLGKPVDLRQARRMIAAAHQLGMEAFGFFMLGAPGETRKTIRRTVAFSLRTRLDYAQYNKYTPYPDSELYNELIRETGHDYWREYILDEQREPQLPRLGTTLTEAGLNRAIRRAFLRFYLRPSIAGRVLLRLRSSGEFRRLLRAAWAMLREKPKTLSKLPSEKKPSRSFP